VTDAATLDDQIAAVTARIARNRNQSPAPEPAYSIKRTPSRGLWRYRSTVAAVSGAERLREPVILSPAQMAVARLLDRRVTTHLPGLSLDAVAHWLVIDACEHYFAASRFEHRALLTAPAKDRAEKTAQYLQKQLAHIEFADLLPVERRTLETAAELMRKIGREPKVIGRPADAAQAAFILELATIYDFVTNEDATVPWHNTSRANDREGYASPFICFLDCVFDLMADWCQPKNGRTALYSAANRALKANGR
jgi:hypothetical protein